MPQFANQVILITGAASGIGRQLALMLAQEGARIAAVDLQEKPLQTLADELGDRVACCRADVTNSADIQKAVAELEQRLGPTDMLIASAGIGRETLALAPSMNDMEAIIRVNLLGVANSIHAVLPTMFQRRRGHVVALSSLASFRGLPRMTGYCASKAGVNAIMDGFRIELRGLGIHFTTICPGWVRTPMTAPLANSLRNMMEVPDAAQRILWAIRKKKTFYAFPGSDVRRLRFLGCLPLSVSDWFITRLLGKLKKE